MKSRYILLFLLVLMAIFPATSFGQKKKCKEGCAPKVSIYKVTSDSVKLLSYLNHGDNRVKIVLEGGIEKVKNTVFVTSKQAIIHKDTATADEYIIHPQADACEIIVDVKTYEDYYSVRDVKVDGKIVKEIVQKYPPKTYMVSYEKYEVK